VACTCCAESLDIFSERRARRELRRYLRKGLGGADARQLAAWAEEAGLGGRTVLEIGGGIGQLQAELIRRGAERGEVLELLDLYRPLHAELAQATDIAGRTTFRVGDVLGESPEVESADIVVLRRVVCCTPDGPALLAEAAGRTGGILLASYPADRRVVRIVAALQNVLLRLARRRFRVFVHSPGLLAAAATAHGLRRTRMTRGRIWEVASFEPDAR
jgi:magnesium-protoporphyrin O-methyltransferase